MAVTVSGMFGKVDGQIHTYFVDSPVVIDISGLEWPGSSPFNIVRVQVVYDGNIVGNFHSDTGGQSSTSFDISSALRAIWADYDYSWEVRAAQRGLSMAADWLREHRSYSLRIYTEYLDNYGEFVSTQCVDEDGHTDIPGGQCAIGGFTEWERSTIPNKEDADVSYREHENLRYGDASTKPTDIPERVGSLSPTSWVDVNGVNVNMNFWPVGATPASDSQERHAPIVLRDSVPYVDFIFLNRRGAIETCSGQMLEAMGINVKMTQYSHTGRPSFKPERSLTAIGTDGRRSWQMSSGFVMREWAEWWTMEFLSGKRKRWWMRYPLGEAGGTYVPVVVEPAKQDISIYDRSKQNMPHVDFTVTLALEG